MEFKTISFDIWKAYTERYIKKYIIEHDVYEYISSDIEWDISGTVEKVTGDILLYISLLEQDEWDDDFLCKLYNGNTRPSYVSGCGLFHDTFHDEIVEELWSELFSRLCMANDIGEDNERYDDLCDYITDIEKEWIYDLIKKFSKEKVIEILKRKH